MALGLDCQGLACHVARSGTWAALPRRLRHDPMVMGPAQDQMAMDPAQHSFETRPGTQTTRGWNRVGFKKK